MERGCFTNIRGRRGIVFVSMPTNGSRIFKYSSHDALTALKLRSHVDSPVPFVLFTRMDSIPCWRFNDPGKTSRLFCPVSLSTFTRNGLLYSLNPFRQQWLPVEEAWEQSNIRHERIHDPSRAVEISVVESFKNLCCYSLLFAQLVVWVSFNIERSHYSQQSIHCLPELVNVGFI